MMSGVGIMTIDFHRRTNGTQKIIFIENQQVTIPVPGTENQ